MRGRKGLVKMESQIKCLKEIREIGVNYVSSGALTHSAPIMDISLKNLVPVEG